MLFSGMIPVFVFLHIFLRILPTILFQISKTHTHFIYCPISCQISIYDFVPNFQIPLFVKNLRSFLCMSSKILLHLIFSLFSYYTYHAHLNPVSLISFLSIVPNFPLWFKLCIFWYFSILAVLCMLIIR